MAFNGYEVNRSNIYDHNVHDVSGVWWETYEWISAVDIFKRENKRGDVITVWECETEDSPYLIHSYFNDPYSGWVHEQNGLPIEHEMATFEQYAD